MSRSLPQTLPQSSGSSRSSIPRFRMVRTVIALMLREMSTTYGRTPGGYVWALMQPLGSIIVFSLVMSVGLKVRSPGLGTNFPIFYASGILPFQMFNNLSGKISSALPFSRALLFYPRVSFIDAILARFLLNALTHLVVFIILMTGLLALIDAHTLIDPVPVMIGLGGAMLLAAGFGVLTGYLFQIYPVLGSVWNILSTPLLLMSGVLFLYDSLPRWGRDILWYNPLVHIIGLVRRGFYPMYEAAYVSVPYVVGVSMVMLAIGLLLLRRYYQDIISR